MEKVYIALDVESSGPRLGAHSLLSIGACVVTSKPLSVEQAMAQGLGFYAETHPRSTEFSYPAMKVGASELDALKEHHRDLEKGLKRDSIPRYYPGHNAFEPALALQYLQETARCEPVPAAMRRLKKWVEGHSQRKNVVGVVDTTFYDSAWVNYYCTCSSLDPIFGHLGLDLRSVWAGMTDNPDASLSTVGVRGENKRPHHALHDAVWLAEAASIVLFQKMA